MKIVMTGGGSGGHITPILAVAHEIKQLQPTAIIIYIGQTGDSFADIVAESSLIDAVHTVRAGKFRRYHGVGWRQLLDVQTMYLNLRDSGKVLAGLWQSFWLLRRLKPDAVFCKGGFIGVPVGLAAAVRRVPYLTHDSDAIPGLANRIIARWAKYHAVALPADLYPYPAASTIDVGVPVAHTYELAIPERQAAYKRELGLSKYDNIVFVTGGGLGAERLNHAVLDAAPALLRTFPGLCIIHTTGQKHEAKVSASYTKLLAAADRPRIIVRDYVSDLYRYSGAADVVVARGGATSFAEFAIQAKACVIVPNPYLTGGHQLKNAEAYAAQSAIVLVPEAELATDEPVLGRAIARLLHDQKARVALSVAIRQFAQPHAARNLAKLVLATAS